MSRIGSIVAVVGLVVLVSAAPVQAAVLGGPSQPVAEQSSAGSTAADTTEPTASADKVRVVIRFVDDRARADASLTSDHPQVDVTGGRDVAFTPVLYATVPQSTIPDLRARPDVESVVVDTVVRSPEPVQTDGIEGDPAGTIQSQSTPWAISRVGAPTAQRNTDDASERSVDVAVLDTGIDYGHSDLDDNVVWGANFVDGADDRTLAASADDNGHGTRAAGIVAAEDNNRGVVGVAPNAELYSIKVMNSTGAGYYSWWVSGIDAALKGPDGTMGTDDDADVLSMSIGGTSDATNLRNAVQSASNHAVVVASAGNRGDGDPSTNEVGYPAKYSGAIAVAATDRGDLTTKFSSEGSEVELAAPGSGQYTTDIGGGTYYFGGTSAAAPHVAGAAALVIAKDLEDGSRDLSNSDVRKRLQSTATDIEAPGRDNKAGYGLIQADAALSAGNSPPTADAGSDQTVTGGSTVTLDGSGSSDPDGDPYSFAWSQTGGSSVSLSDSDTPTPEFTAPSVSSQTTLTFEVTVTDTNGASSTDTVEVTVQPANDPPTADAGSDQTVTGGSTVALDGTGSSDPNGDPYSFAWSQIGGPGVSLSDSDTATPEFTAPSVTTQKKIQFEVTVTDTSGASSTDTVAITVQPLNDPPTADAGSNFTVEGGYHDVLDASGSTDPNGDALSYQWTQVAGPSAPLDTPTSADTGFTAPEVSSNTTIRFQVTVTDTNGATDTDTVTVTVTPNNEVPTADAGADVVVRSGETVQLDASGTSDPEGDTITYGWSQTSGPSVVLLGPSVRPTFTAPTVSSNTTLTFKLTVLDDQHSYEFDTDVVNVTVRPARSGAGRYDLDNDGTVDAGEVSDVIAAYNSGRQIGTQAVTASDVMDAIAAYNA